MKKLALILVASAAVAGAASTAQAHEWGGGYGYGPVVGHHHMEYRDGYRGARFRHDLDDRPAVRVYERRGYGFRHHHWDGDDD